MNSHNHTSIIAQGIFFMKLRNILTTSLLLAALGACKMETIADPKLSLRDTEFMARAPKMPDLPYGEFNVEAMRIRTENKTGEKAGTIVVDSETRYLYLVEETGKTALRYRISPGEEAHAWTGTAYIRQKKEWPSWTPGNDARKRNASLPASVPGGPLNPMGARALYLHDEAGRDTMYRIHGTNEPESIGMAVSLGCIRMQNIDSIDLYNRVESGTKVVVR
jgi:lipoprotein-anchoring transpeptidase ErfK/SrfK